MGAAGGDEVALGFGVGFAERAAADQLEPLRRVGGFEGRFRFRRAGAVGGSGRDAQVFARREVVFAGVFPPWVFSSQYSWSAETPWIPSSSEAWG